MDQIKPEFLKKLTKLVAVFIWVLSLLTTHNFYLYRFTIQLVTRGVDKNNMFLLCNGLIVFVAKFSGLISTSKPVLEESSCKTDNKMFDYRDFESYNAILELDYYSVNGEGTESFLAEEVTEIAEDFLEDQTKDQETEEEKEEEECDIGDGFREDEANDGLITEEEMNKKFDEFIRKMKEELRIEAKRQLILV